MIHTSRNNFLNIVEKCRQAAKSGDNEGKENAIIELTEIASKMSPDELEEIIILIK